LENRCGTVRDILMMMMMMLWLILRAREQLGKGNETAELQTIYFLDERLMMHANATGRQN
jgi:hypothetical protein